MSNSEKLINWVAEQHGNQLIKKTKLPYLNHLIAVGNLSESFVRLGFEIGLCHDLLEDTSATVESLFNALQNFGYSLDDADHIVSCVKELTDVFSKNQFPDLNKKERKERESERLVSISPTSQTVKYADLNDNINWMLKYDKKKVKSYLEKKRTLLIKLNKGSADLREKILILIDGSLAKSAN